MMPLDPSTRPKLQIANWSPRSFSEIVGTSNRAPADRLQRIAKRHQEAAKLSLFPPPHISKAILIIGQYGVGKTEAARLLVQACCCESPAPDGNPCRACNECLNRGPQVNGTGNRYRTYDYDCTRITSKAALASALDEIEGFSNTATVWDQIDDLPQAAMKMLLATVRDFPGLFIATADESHITNIIPPLYERLSKIWLDRVAEHELTDFFSLMLPVWNIKSSRELIGQMVQRTDRSFRTCLDILQYSSDHEGGMLTLAVINSFVGICPETA